MKKYQTTLSAKYLFRICLVIFSIFMSACNKDYPNLLREFKPSPELEIGKPKVLLIVVDGLRGNAVQDNRFVNLNELQRNALYSFNGLSDIRTNPMTNEAAWTSIMTGVFPDKHGVQSTDFSSINLQEYPTVFERLKRVMPSLKTASFTASQSFSEHLSDKADLKQTFNADDDAMFATALKELKGGESDMVLMQFQGVQKAANESDYNSTTSKYMEAIAKVDANIGEAVAAIKQRATYSQEKWLVIITSTKGGAITEEAIDNTVFGDKTRNTFVMFYSPKFFRKLIVKPNSLEIPYLGNNMRFTYVNPEVTATLNNNNALNFENNKSYTLVLFVKHNKAEQFNYPPIISKRANAFSGTGWTIAGVEGRWTFHTALVTGNDTHGGMINDAKWHALTVVINRSNNTVSTFTDGKHNNTKALATGSFVNTSALTIGKINGTSAGANVDYGITNLQIYDKAFSNEEVMALSGKVQIDNSHPYFDNLKGYWPSTEDVGTNKLTDMSGNTNDFKISGPLNWMSVNEVVSYFRPAIAESYYRTVPSNVDISFMIYQWYGIVDLYSWSLDGRGQTPQYSTTGN